MKLRCFIKKEGNYYVATCLELSLSVRCNRLDTCKRKMATAIKDYMDSVTELYKNGEKVNIRPVDLYLFKRIIFDVLLFIKSKFKYKNFSESFIEEVVVPSGI